MIAGGASLAPRRWSLPTSEADCRSRSAWISTALMMQGQYQQKLDVLVGSITGIEKIYAVICSQRPVIMFAGTIYTRKRLSCSRQVRP